MTEEPPSAATTTPPQPTSSSNGRLRRYGPPASILLGFALLIVAVLTGTGVLPSARSAAGGVLSSALPWMSSGDAATLAAVIMLGVSAGLLLVGSSYAANFVLHALTRVVPSLQSTLSGAPLVLSLEADVSETMVRAGVTGLPIAYVRRYATYAVASAVILLPSSIAATLILGEPLFLTANAVPFILLAYPSLISSSKVGDTVRGVDEELPYFAIFAAILQSAGLTLYSAMTRVAEAKIFKWMEYEGMLIARENLFFGKTQIGAIVERGAQHPSERFRNFLQGYTSILASGGDAAKYLEDKAKDLIYWTEFRWRSYSQSASDLGEAIISIFFTLPVLVIAGAIVTPGDTVALLAGMILLVIPIMGVLEYAAILRIQPKSYDSITGWTLPGLTVAFGSFAVMFFLHEPAWLSIATSVVAFSCVYGWSTYWQIREVRKCEEALPQFMRDVTEYKKIGYDITKAIRRLAAERSYNRYFDNLLGDVATQIELGSTMKEAIVKTRSWLTRMVFSMLGEVVETGGGTPALLETITDFTQRIVGVRRETKANMRTYSILAYATPIGLALVILTMYYMIGQFGSSLGGGQGLGILSGAANLPASFLDLTKVLVVEAAVITGFLAGKTVDFTGKNTFRIAAGVGVAVVAIVVSQALFPMLGILNT